MAAIHGPLHYERTGVDGPVLAFIHPNPMDQSAWLYQLAHLATWYRCVAIDVPGYGRSPRADPGLTMDDMAAACWDVLDRAVPGDPVVVVGCSIGSLLAPFMLRQRRERTAAIVLVGSGAFTDKQLREGLDRVIGRYEDDGLDFRGEYALLDFAPAFRGTAMAHFLAEMFMERNHLADLGTILHQLRAIGAAGADAIFADVDCPTLIVAGREDHNFPNALALHERLAGSELHIIDGAGHACQLEQPWAFDRILVDFLRTLR